MLLFPWLRCWHGSGLETERIISVAPNGCFQQIADGQFQFHPLADAEIGRNNRFCSPAAGHRIHIASDTDIRAETVVEADVGIAAISGGIHEWAKTRCNNGIARKIIAESIERDGSVDIIAYSATKAVLRNEPTLHGHPILVGCRRCC